MSLELFNLVIVSALKLSRRPKASADSLDYLSCGGSIFAGHSDDLEFTRGHVGAVSRDELIHMINCGGAYWVVVSHRD